jgi:outer membrane protein
MKHKILAWPWVVFFAFCHAMGAQELMTLEDAVAIGLQKNFDLQLRNREIQIANNRNHSGRAGRQPVVNSFVNWNNSLNYSRLKFISGVEQIATNAYNTNLSGGIQVDYALWDGGKGRNRQEILGYLALISSREMEFWAQNLIADIGQAYLSIQLQQAYVETLEEQLSFSRQRYVLAKKRQEIGSGSLLDVMQSEVSLRTDSTEWVKQRNVYERLQVNLLSLINLPPQSTYQYEALANPGPLPGYGFLLELLNKQNPEVMRQKAELMRMESEYKLAQSDRMPTLQVFTGINSTYSQSAVGFVLSNVGMSPFAGVGIAYTLWDGKVRKWDQENARISWESSKIQLEKTKVDLSNQLFSSYKNYQNTLEMVEIERANVDLAKRNLSVARASYEAGGISDLELRSIQNLLLEAQFNFLNALKMVSEEKLNVFRITGDYDQVGPY